PQNGGTNSLAFSGDGTFIATATADKRVRIFQVLSGREGIKFAREQNRNAVAVTTDRNYIATGGDDETIIFDGRSGREIGKLATGIATSLDFNRGGTLLAVSHLSSAVDIYNWRYPSRPPLACAHPDEKLTYGTFSPAGVGILAAISDKTARLFDVKT